MILTIEVQTGCELILYLLSPYLDEKLFLLANAVGVRLITSPSIKNAKFYKL